MRPAQPGSARERPLVVTGRWDQLGGRLTGLTNAIALAEALDLEFRLVWPRGQDAAVNDPGELFASEYLAAFEIDAAALREKTAIWFGELVTAQLDYIAARLAGAGADGYIDVDLLFEPVRLADEPPELAAERFVRCWDAIGWSDAVRGLAIRCSDALRGFNGAGGSQRPR